jgi:hypothetical protein
MNRIHTIAPTEYEGLKEFVRNYTFETYGNGERRPREDELEYYKALNDIAAFEIQKYIESQSAGPEMPKQPQEPRRHKAGKLDSYADDIKLAIEAGDSYALGELYEEAVGKHNKFAQSKYLKIYYFMTSKHRSQSV